MEPIFKWELRSVYCKPAFTDKYGNLRTEVIKNVMLAYVGQLGERKEEHILNASLKLIDLSSFIDKSNLSDEQIVQMGLASRNQKEIEHIETSIKNRF